MQVLSEVNISNLAISHIGSTAVINNLTEASIEAQQCNLHFFLARDLLLEEQDWTFAGREDELVLSGGTPPKKWKFEYRRPNNCAFVRHISADAHDIDTMDPIEYETGVSADGSSRVIWTNQEFASARYTVFIEDTALFPFYFSNLLSYRLARKIRSALDGSISETKLAQMEGSAWETAMGNNGNERHEQALTKRVSNAIEARV